MPKDVNFLNFSIIIYDAMESSDIVQGRVYIVLQNNSTRTAIGYYVNLNIHMNLVKI